ncbi:eukaryotic translation initiation factor 4 gamma, 1 [Elysia marginata]|uniref:Eukaryotic translation initiation factor 4 gamma, 1 n=1 Tax=Elysia marginata TaxID=1093978 RepID=A0AAV4H8W3_9GAST|nr:eukaryotic translation initiation factor 4 gamma, 1 [Elysia marginata]
MRAIEEWAKSSAPHHWLAVQSGLGDCYYYRTNRAALSGGFEFIASQQPLLPYQAYGSAVNEVRGQPGNGARGGPPQQTMHQGGAAFYQQQPGGTMRPPQQGQVNQQALPLQYFISAAGMQNNMRTTRAHHPTQTPAMVYIPQAPFPANNVVMYQQRPQMNPGYYTSVPQNTYPTLYFPPSGGPNGQWQGPRMPTAGPAPARPVREKKIIEIKDPNTGKNVTEELINRAQAEHTEPEEEPPQNSSNQEISKLFTRMVAESLKSPEDSNASGASDSSQMASIPPQGPGVQSSQQYQQPPPSAAQQPPPPMIRPGHPGMAPPRMPPPSHIMHPRPGMMPQQQQGQPPATPPHDMMMNFTRPPPPLRQPTPAQVYSTAQQHLVRQQQQQPVHQHQQQMLPQGLRQPNVPVLPNQVPVQQPQQQQAPVQPQVQQHQTPQPEGSSAVPTVAPAAPAPLVSEQPSPATVSQTPKEESVSQPPAENIPAVKAPSPPVKEETPQPQAPSQPVQKEPTPPAEEVGKVPEGKEDMPQGASNRGAKDGRKGKKNKRDFNTKDIGGSDMDAFIDNEGSQSSSKKGASLQNGDVRPANGAAVVEQQSKQQPQPTNSLTRDPKNPWNVRPPSLVSSSSSLNTGAKSGSHLVTATPSGAKGCVENLKKEEAEGRFHGDVNLSSNKAVNSTKVLARNGKTELVKMVLVGKGKNEQGSGKFTIPLYPSSDEKESSSGEIVDVVCSIGISKQSSFQEECQKEMELYSHEKQIFDDAMARAVAPHLSALPKQPPPTFPHYLVNPIVFPILQYVPPGGVVQVLPALQAGQVCGEIHTDVSNVDAVNRSLNASSTTKHEATSSEQSGKQLAVGAQSENATLNNKNSLSPSNGLAADSDTHMLDKGNEECHGDGATAAIEEKEVAEGFPELQKSRESQRQAESTAQVESKHKLKKKKKRKGRKSPPFPKSKQNAVEEKENGNTSKPPLPSSSAERQVSVEKPASQQQEAKSVEQGVANDSPIPPAAPVAKEDSCNEKLSQNDDNDSSATEEKTSSPEETPDAVVPAEPVPEQKAPVAALRAEDKKPEDAAPATNQNQDVVESSDIQQEQSVAHSVSTPKISVVPSDNIRTVSDSKEKSNDLKSKTPVNDENVPPKELSLRPNMEDAQPDPPSREDSVEAPSKTPTEKPGAAVKKEGKDKLQYDRAYLMELRECPSSQTKPEGLPNLEIILDRPVNRAASGTSPDFTPNFFQPSTPQRHPQQMGKSASRGRARPGEMPMPQRIIKSVSIQNDVKALHQSEKPWKPSQKQIAAGEISTKVENLESKALFILNRLTPTNFASLSDEMIGLKITDYEQLEQLVKIFFDKVTLETKFVEAYAKLCKKMCSLKVPPPQGMKENQASFRVLLLTKCQKEFESDKTVVFEDPEEKRKKLEAELPDGPEKADKIETTLYHMKLRRLKFYGNIRFIGELFKLSMLTENIMHDCIFGLLKARDDESLLSLCQLITTVGSILDTDKAKQRMDQYFNQMVKIAEERKSRIKFTLKDAIELRQNNWVPRKEQTGPKKIDEVRQDFHQEQQTKQFLQNQPPPPRNDPQPGSRRGSRQRQEEKPSDDGWNTVGSKSIRIDASKMKFSKSVVDENIQLGPGGGMNKFSMWSRGSGAAAQSAQDSPASRPANRFSALPSEEDRRFQRSPSRGEGGGMGNRGLRPNTAGHGRGKMIGRSSIEGERRDALASARSIVGGRSQNSSRDNSWNRDDRRSLGPRSSGERDSMGPPRTITLRPSAERGPPPPSAPAPSSAFGNVKKAATKTADEMEHSAKTIMDEYLNIQDMKEAKLCLMELEGQPYLHMFISASMNNVLERSDKDRTLTGQFFQEMLKDNLISLDKFIKGLGEVLEFAEDMVIDIPKMWTNLAQLMTPTLVGGSMPWTKLKPTLEAQLSAECSAKLIAEILLIAKTLVSEAEVAKMWKSSGLSWEAFLPADRVSDFIQMRKLEFLQGAADATSPTSGQVNGDAITADLVKMIKEAKPNSDIEGYIKNKVPRDVNEKLLVRLLMTAVIKASLSATLKPNMEVVANRQELLQKYIKTPDLELQALYAIQALMHRLEHPGGVIDTVFEALYNEEVVSEEAFKQWEVSTEEQEGKGTCCKQLTRFFAWLRENEDLEAS